MNSNVLIVVPCFNEALNLPETVNDLPDKLTGIDNIEVLVIDDGSTDETAKIAEEIGVHHVIRLPQHLGLAAAFVSGLEASLMAQTPRHAASPPP